MGRRLPVLAARRTQCCHGAVEPIAITGLLLRRAVLGTLLGRGPPLTARRVADALADSGATTTRRLTKGPSRVIADLLAHQVRAGTVRKSRAGHVRGGADQHEPLDAGRWPSLRLATCSPRTVWPGPTLTATGPPCSRRVTSSDARDRLASEER